MWHRLAPAQLVASGYRLLQERRTHSTKCRLLRRPDRERSGADDVIHRDQAKQENGVPTTSINAASAAAGILAAALTTAALAQEPQPVFVARADVTVANSSPVPQTVAGTNVPPFELAPHQQAKLAMNVTPPAPPPGQTTVPVRFYYSVGSAPGPQCRGTIEMRVTLRGGSFNRNEATNCHARSLGTGGASCNIAVSARNSACEGGLAFVAP
jgi:hypothetical protein